MKFTFDEIKKAIKAEVEISRNTTGLFSVSTDSRTVNENNIYLPLKGEKFDGHDFIEDALKKGAKGYFTSDKSKIFPNAKFVFYVKDTLKAYLQLAAYYKSKVNPITIAVTGSSGKTTTIEMLASVISQKYKTHKSILNHNNEVGLCQTLLAMPDDTDVLVVEMGMRGKGEIELLSKYAKPDIAVIANTGTAHIGRLGSEKAIAEAKCEITKYLHKEGLLLAHNTELIRQTNTYKGNTVYLGLDSKELSDIKLEASSSEFVYKKYQFKLNVEGEHNIQNALFAINAGIKLGIEPELIAKGLEEYKPIEKRWEISEIAGYRIINDSYNSNPESAKAAISAFLSTQKTISPRVLVLGDMKELGENEKSFHENVGEFINNFDNVEVITVGELAKYYIKGLDTNKNTKSASFSTNKDAAKYILENIPTGTTILLKASRSMKFEEIITELKK